MSSTRLHSPAYPEKRKMSTCAPTTVLLFLAMIMITTASGIQELELEVVKRAQTHVSEARRWVQGAVELSGVDQLRGYNGDLGVALRDCDQLYEESESRVGQLRGGNGNRTVDVDDARAWLSSVLASHRTCLDGLSEKGFDGGPMIRSLFQNLTSLLGEVLANLHGQPGRGSPRRSPVLLGHSHEGVLASWNPATSKADFVVAQDGSGTHKTINAALAALSTSRGRSTQTRTVVYVKAGVYHEKVEVGKQMKNVMFVGDGIDRTIVTGNRNVPDGSSTFSSATFGVSGDGFWARDMTFENTAGPLKQQAVALRVNSDLAVFYRCRIRGYQDTLFVQSLRQFYRDCQIHGTIDFIFGDASVVLQNCDIFLRRPMANQANVITAQGRESPHENTGISIQGSRVRPASDLAPVKGSFRSYLGRPWKKYSRTGFLECDLDGLIDPSGWKEWKGSFALSTLFYAEYRNTGAGASTQRRVGWRGFHVFRSPQEVSAFTVSRLLQGDSWIPATGVPFLPGL